MKQYTRFLSDVVGDDYKTWDDRKIILITAATGSGKSYFILHKLLKWIASKGKRLLYLVNRIALKAQIEKEIQGSVFNEMYKECNVRTSMDAYIKVYTYQNIEQRLRGANYDKIIKELEGFDYVVYDECHYFHNDALFNTSTELSYDCLRTMFNSKVQIFMSATMERLKKVIYGRPPVFYSFTGGGEAGNETLIRLWLRDRIREYSMEPDYSYIKWEIFENIEHLESIILDKSREGEKWLIFTDSIDRGKRLKERLVSKDFSRERKQIGCNTEKEDKMRYIDEKEVAFIDANYGYDEDAAMNMHSIVNWQHAEARIVIATAVLDNGVSLHDSRLRNIVILGDTEESFIQMLGRKRRDNESVTLYICKQNVKHFSDRRGYLNDLLEFQRKHEGSLKKNFNYYDKLYYIYPFAYIYYARYVRKYNPEYIKAQKAKYIREYLRQNNLCAINQNLKTAEEAAEQYCQQWDMKLDPYYQQDTLEDIIRNERMAWAARRMCYSVNGILTINYFAISQLLYLKSFYDEMIEELEKDENAFVKRQMAWLGLTPQAIEEKIVESVNSVDEYHRMSIEKEIKLILNKELDKESNKEIKKKLRGDLEYFARKGGEVNLERKVTRADATLTAETFNKIMKLAQLPYKMIKPDGPKSSRFVIEEISASEN